MVDARGADPDAHLAGEVRDRPKRRGVGNAGEHELVGKEREEPIGLGAPSITGLGEVLEAGEDQEPLATTLGNGRRQVRERCT